MLSFSTTVDNLETTALTFSDEFDRFITLLRLSDVWYDTHGQPDILDQVRPAAIATCASALVLASLNTIARWAQADERVELASPHYLLYRISRELDKIVTCLEIERNVLSDNDIKETYRIFFNELGFTEENGFTRCDDPESEFHDLQDYLYYFNPSISAVRRLGRGLLCTLGLGKKRGNKTLKELKEHADRYERYIGTLALFPFGYENNRPEGAIGMRQVIERDFSVPPEEELLPKLNTWEKWFSALFMIREMDVEKESGWLGAVARTHAKIKHVISTAWDGLANYSGYFWVAWATVWAIAGSTVVATTIGTGLVLGIPLIPAAGFFIYRLFNRDKTDKQTIAQEKAQATANQLFFATSYLQTLKYAYEKIYVKRIELLAQIDEQDKGKARKSQDVTSKEDASREVAINDIRVALNARHANGREIWRHLKHLRPLNALTLAVRLAFQEKKNINYRSPTQVVLDRLDSRFEKNKNFALSFVTGFFNGSVMTAFSAWPVTSFLVFAGVSAAGGPIAQLACYGIAGLIGAFSAVKQATTTSIEVKKQQQIIEKHRAAVLELIEEERKYEYLRIQLQDNYQLIQQLSRNERDANLFKPVLPKKDLVTQDRFTRRKTTEKSAWTFVKKFLNRALVTVSSAETGMLVARLLFFSGGVLPMLGELGLVPTLGASKLIAALFSAGFMLAGTKLYAYSINKQRERDMAIIQNAHLHLHVVKEANAFLELQLQDQCQHLLTLQHKETQVPRPVRSSVALIRSRLEAGSSLQTSVKETADIELQQGESSSQRAAPIAPSVPVNDGVMEYEEDKSICRCI